MGEAIASRDFFLLVWSQHTATSHFVEFEWNTALALRKVIVPCLLDDTPLPPSLRAINALFCKNLETALPRILQALQQPLPASNTSHAEAVINKLQTIRSTEPEQVVHAAKTLFAQQHWNVQGNVYQAAGDINVTLAPAPEKPEKKLLERWQTWVGLIGGILAIVLGVMELRDKIFPPNSSPQVEIAISPLRGWVKNSKGEFIANAMIIAEGLQSDTTYTDSFGGFYFAKLPGKINERVRVYVYQQGRRLHDEYVTLPGPAKLVLEE